MGSYVLLPDELHSGGSEAGFFSVSCFSFFSPCHASRLYIDWMPRDMFALRIKLYKACNFFSCVVDLKWVCSGKIVGSTGWK